jgi:hypothetical protein
LITTPSSETTSLPIHVLDQTVAGQRVGRLGAGSGCASSKVSV